MEAIAASRSWKCVRNHKLAQKICWNDPQRENRPSEGKILSSTIFPPLENPICSKKNAEKENKNKLIMEESQNTCIFILLLTCLLRIFRFFLPNTFSNKARGNKYMFDKSTRGKRPTIQHVNTESPGVGRATQPTLSTTGLQENQMSLTQNPTVTCEI